MGFAAGFLILAAVGCVMADNRTVMLWLMNGKDEATWTSWFSTLSEHVENVTSVSPCVCWNWSYCDGVDFVIVLLGVEIPGESQSFRLQVYLLDRNGSFGLQVSEAEAELAYSWSSKIKSSLNLEVLPLIAGDPTGVIHGVLVNKSVQASFIESSISEAELRGYDGYNLDAEGPVKDAETGQAYIEFLNAWADALHAKGMKLSVEIAGVCHGSDFFGASCDMFRKESRVDRVVTMATYEGYRPKWLDLLVDAWGGLGTLLGAGMEMNELEQSSYPAQKLAELGVQELDFWVNMPTSQTAWNNIGLFLHAP